MDGLLKLLNSYIDLGEKFFQRVLPEKVPEPQLLLWNHELASDLFISKELQSDNDLLSQYFSGNQLPDGAVSVALAYSGHQFGHFNPQLGDGRAHLLGEVIDKDSMRRDIQLKGSGQTAFSRRGDGKCALAPALREYIMSEALNALGVPTSRCLAVVRTVEEINREEAKSPSLATSPLIFSLVLATSKQRYFCMPSALNASYLIYALNTCPKQHIPVTRLYKPNFTIPTP